MGSRALPPLSLHAWLRFDAVTRLLPAGVERVLEIGAGQGAMGALLARRYQYVGLEPDPTSCDVARRRIGPDRVYCVDAETYEADQPFDLVCAFEVLEHLEDDRGAVARWSRFARPGGWIFVSVPAGARRVGAADERAGHLRRYDRGDVVSVLTGAGLVEPSVVTYGFPLGYLLEAARNVLAARTPAAATLGERTSASGRWLQPPDQAAWATYVAALPFRLLQRPFGGSELGTGLVARAVVRPQRYAPRHARSVTDVTGAGDDGQRSCHTRGGRGHLPDGERPMTARV